MTAPTFTAEQIRARAEAMGIGAHADILAEEYERAGVLRIEENA
jgi:hypothetical protein